MDILDSLLPKQLKGILPVKMIATKLFCRYFITFAHLKETQ